VYELMFFVTKPQRIDVPVASLTEFLPGSYQGFMPIKDERIEAIIAKHGSIQGFAESLIGPTPKGAPQSWIFQGNPEKYDIRAAVNALTEDDWTVSSYKKEIKPGDRIYLWEAGQQGGIVAVAEILDNPSPRPGQPESIPFMKDPSLNTERVRVRIGLRRILDPILGREQIKGTAALANLSILRFSNATNFRVTPEEADVIEALIASQVDSKDLKSVETLRKLYGAFQQSGEYAEWQTKLRSFISDVAAASKEERATPVLQQRLWNDNEVSSPGRGDISVETALADEQFREWVATVSVQPVPEALDQAVAYFEGLYEELVERVRIFTPRVPYLKIFRVLTAFFPKHFTVIADRGSLRALHEAMFVVEQQSAVARHLEVVRRLEEALGPMPTDPAGLVQRMTFPWFLFDTIVRPKVVVPEPPKGGGKQSLLAALREANLYFSEELVANYLLALQTRRFVILTGMSGTGKSQLARIVAQYFGPKTSAPPTELAPADVVTIQVQPYMLKHDRMRIPAAVRMQLVLPPPDPGTVGGGRLSVVYPYGKEMLAFWRAPDGNNNSLFFKGPFRDWFAGLPVGTTLGLRALEPGDEGNSTLQLRIVAAQETSAIDHYCIVPVRPDWTDNRGLLGYYNPIADRYVIPQVLQLLLRARDEVDRAHVEKRIPAPFFIVLDEMNLARVEQYFSDFLSSMESGEAIELHQEMRIEEGETDDSVRVPRTLRIPANVFITGTVNVDETTYMFSPKVLDRAFTIELDAVDLATFGKDVRDSDRAGLKLVAPPKTLAPVETPDTNDWNEFGGLLDGELRDVVIALHLVLEEHNRHFGYRVATEIARFVTLAAEQSGSSAAALWDALDLALLEKVLPKFHGTQEELEKPLRSAFAFAIGTKGDAKAEAEEFEQWQRVGTILTRQSDPAKRPKLPRLASKIHLMLKRVRAQGFASFIQ
jgi:energy-coupling factor transporter ATP-binding protein EcfA2